MNEKEYWGMQENAFCLLMHLSQLLGFIVPLAGLIMPIVMWATQKDRSAVIDLQGRIILNWMLSVLIYLLISIPLSFLGIGVLLIAVVGILSLVFVILGAVKANRGETWIYPVSIDFFGVKARHAALPGAGPTDKGP